jgi:hypothetical protein
MRHTYCGITYDSNTPALDFELPEGQPSTLRRGASGRTQYLRHIPVPQPPFPKLMSRTIATEVEATPRAFSIPTECGPKQFKIQNSKFKQLVRACTCH